MTTNELIRHLERDHGVRRESLRLSPSWRARIKELAFAHFTAHGASREVTHTHPQSHSESTVYHPRFPGEKVGGAF